MTPEDTLLTIEAFNETAVRSTERVRRKPAWFSQMRPFF